MVFGMGHCSERRHKPAVVLSVRSMVSQLKRHMIKHLNLFICLFKVAPAVTRTVHVVRVTHKCYVRKENEKIKKGKTKKSRKECAPNLAHDLFFAFRFPFCATLRRHRRTANGSYYARFLPQKLPKTVLLRTAAHNLLPNLRVSHKIFFPFEQNPRHSVVPP